MLNPPFYNTRNNDSHELQAATPNPLIVNSLYLLMGVLGFLLLMLCFIEIELPLKTTGIVKPNDASSLIINKISGKVTNVFIKNGQKVRQGEVLYTLANNSYDQKKIAASDELRKIEDHIKNLRILEECITESINPEESQKLFLEENGHEYYYRYLDYVTKTKKLANQLKQKKVDYYSLAALYKKGAIAREKIIAAQEALNSLQLDLKIFQNKTLIDIQNDLTQKEEVIAELQNQIENVNLNIKASSVNAPNNGIIRIITPLKNGALLQNGVAIASILPEDKDPFVVQLRIPNSYSSRIKKHQSVKYRFFLSPSKNYHELTGKITEIKFNQKQTTKTRDGFSLVQASIEAPALTNAKIDTALIKENTPCEVFLIAETKKLFFYILDKLTF